MYSIAFPERTSKYNLNKCCIVFVLIVIQLSLQAQDDNRFAPLSPEFAEWMKKRGTSERTYFIPSPVYYHYNPSALKSLKGLKLPERFDYREDTILTTVKNQKAYGACWSFSVAGVIESYLKKTGAGDFDLSEKNMITCHGFEWHFSDKGGNFDMAFAYLSRWDGPVLENEDPYSSLDSTSTCTLGFIPLAFIDEMRYIPNNAALVKNHIKNYGPVSTIMKYGTGGSKSPYFNKQDNTFWYHGTEPPDHGVIIVGWDDTMPVKNMYTGEESTGVWIVRNSWGENWGEGGYFYVAYDDNKILSQNAIFNGINDFDPERRVIHYDKLGATTSLRGKDNTGYGIVSFTIPEGYSVLQAGTYVQSSGATVSFELFTDFDTTTMDVKNRIASKQDARCNFPGYYLFDLPAEVSGEVYLKIKYYTPGYDYPIPAEVGINGYCNPEIEEGKCWVSEDDVTWEKIGVGTDIVADLSVRLYAKKNSSPIALFSAQRSEVCKQSLVSFSNNSMGDITSCTWDFGQAAVPQTLITSNVDSAPEVYYTEDGDKKVQLTVTGPTGSGVFAKRISVISDNLNVSLTSNKPYVVLGKSIYLFALGEADEYSWGGSPHLQEAGFGIARITPDAEGEYTYYVTGTQGECSGSSEIDIEVHRAPENDDISNAWPLQYGYNGPFTNKYATVEDNEPYPDTTLVLAQTTNSTNPCNSQITWCHEGGLQHSVWFSIRASETGILAFDSYGFDNQLALYDAESFEDVFVEGKYTLLAANDDFHPDSMFYAARITPVAGLTPGKTYWLQVDGSHGGDEGQFELLVYNLEVQDLDSLKNAPFFSHSFVDEELFLNPGENEIPGCTIQLYTVNGQIVFEQYYESLAKWQTYRIDVSFLSQGYYFIRVDSKGFKKAFRFFKK